VPIPVLLLVLNQILEGLDYAHNARSGDDGSLLQVIHRDLKPSNIAIAPNGMVKLIDFGIARAAIDRGGMETSGAIRGTPRYMSPEQIETPNEMTPASDLFSLGALLYEMVTTKPLFKARPGQEALDLVLRLSLDEHIERVEAVMPGLGAIFARLTERRIVQRYTSAVSVLGDLKPLIEEHGDRDAARAYLAMLVAEYKEDLNAEELIPEDFEPVISSTVAPTTTRRGEGPPETKPLPSAILSLELGPDGHHATEVLATIPLPPRPEELITGRHQQLGPGSNASGTTATHATGDRPYHSVDPSSSMSAGMPGRTTATVRETGGNWGLVAALAVPLVVLVLVLLMVGGGALMSRRGAPAEQDPFDDGIHGGNMIVIEDGGEQTPIPAEVTVEPLQADRDRIAREKRHAERERRRQEEAEEDERGMLGASDGDRDPGDSGSTAEVEEDPTPTRHETTERTPEPDEDPEPTGDPGTLVVDADPWATVWVDLKYEGETPISVKVSAGHHTITMKCMGDGPEHTRRVTVDPGSREPYFRQFTESQCP